MLASDWEQVWSSFVVTYWDISWDTDFPNVNQYLLLIILVNMIVLIAPSIVHFYQESKSSKR